MGNEKVHADTDEFVVDGGWTYPYFQDSAIIRAPIDRWADQEGVTVVQYRYLTVPASTVPVPVATGTVPVQCTEPFPHDDWYCTVLDYFWSFWYGILLGKFKSFCRQCSALNLDLAATI